MVDLAQFSGQLFKRYSVECRPLIRYLLAQLADHNADDLIVLRELMASMTGMEAIAPMEMTEDQIEALGGLAHPSTGPSRPAQLEAACNKSQAARAIQKVSFEL